VVRAISADYKELELYRKHWNSVGHVSLLVIADHALKNILLMQDNVRYSKEQQLQRQIHVLSFHYTHRLPRISELLDM
jgi:UDP-N-acetylenolpyruvoylglucosamine reductase